MILFDRSPDEKHPIFIIAEAGINHNGHFDLALELVRRARQAGADCVKFQTFRTWASESKHSGMPGYFTGRIDGTSKQEWSKSLEFSVDQFVQLKEYCEKLGIAFLSTACDIEGLRILVEIGADALKIASADTNNDYLLRAAAGTGLPVILSTGMSTDEEVAHAVETLKSGGTEKLALMQCTSQYPTPFEQIHLRVMETFKTRYGCLTGFSDHSEGIQIPIAAAALEADMIEKHFTLSRHLPGVDHAASIDPAEFTRMVTCIRQVEAALGDSAKTIQPDETDNINTMRRSLMASRHLTAGVVLRLEDITAKRPGTGLPPSEIDKLIGKRLLADMEPEDLFSMSMVL